MLSLHRNPFASSRSTVVASRKLPICGLWRLLPLVTLLVLLLVLFNVAWDIPYSTVRFKDSKVQPQGDKSMHHHPKTAANQINSTPPSLKNPVPAVVCASSFPDCKVRICSSPSGKTVADPSNHSATIPLLPSFLRPHPSAHYGYGLVHRQDRGLKMQIPGAAKSGSGCALSHKYQFMFVHVLKSGGTTIKGFLQRALCNGTTKACPYLEIVDCATAIVAHPHYFVFSFVRNPYSRMYSAYAMADAFRHHNPPTRPKP